MNVHQFKAKLKEMNFDGRLTEEVDRIIAQFLDSALKSPLSHTKGRFSKSIYLPGGNSYRDEEPSTPFSAELLALATKKELEKRGFTVTECKAYDDQREGSSLSIAISWPDGDNGGGDSRDLDYFGR